MIRELIMNRIKDFFSKIQDKKDIEKYDKITGVDILGKVKGVTTTEDCKYFKELKNKEQSGLISLDKLLDDELENSMFSDIYFCDKEKTICLHNHQKDSYVEPIHECFDSATEKIYLVCDSIRSYNISKEFIKQNSKYYSYIKTVYELPNKETFEKIFLNKKDIDNLEVTERNENSQNNSNEKIIHKNQIEVDGIIKKIGNQFQKKDGNLAKFITIEQDYEYNDKIQKNNISVMLDGSVLAKNKETLKVGDNITVEGKLNSYIDKNNNNQSVINCYELKISNKTMGNNMER